MAMAQMPGSTVVDRTSHYTDVAVPVRVEQSFVGWILGFDDKAVILDPPELRATLVDHVKATR